MDNNIGKAFLIALSDFFIVTAAALIGFIIGKNIDLIYLIPVGIVVAFFLFVSAIVKVAVNKI